MIVSSGHTVGTTNKRMVLSPLVVIWITFVVPSLASIPNTLKLSPRQRTNGVGMLSVSHGMTSNTFAVTTFLTTLGMEPALWHDSSTSVTRQYAR